MKQLFEHLTVQDRSVAENSGNVKVGPRRKMAANTLGTTKSGRNFDNPQFTWQFGPLLKVNP